MADLIVQTPAQPTGTPAAQAQTQGQAAATVPAPTTEPSAEDLRAELLSLKNQLSTVNRESAERRHKLAELETAETKRKEAEMTEAQKLQAQLDKLTKERDESIGKVQQQAKFRAFEKAARAAKLNWANDDALEDGFRLADLSTVKADGETVEGMDAVLKDLAAKKPYLFKTAEAPPDVNATPRGAQGQRIGMTPEETKEFAAIYGLKPEFLPVAHTPNQGR
jgi:hypothetical protein